MDRLQQLFFGNSLQDWAIALLILLLVALGFEILKRLILRRIDRTPELKAKGLDRLINNLLSGTRSYFVFLIALYLATLTIDLPESVNPMIKTLVIVITILQCGFWGSTVIDFLIERRIQARPGEEGDTATVMGAVKLVAKIALWTIVILLILENLTGIEIGALLATLGVGGIAIALAVQGILGDLFASVSISLDKPFVIGDTIGLDNLTGEVEKIGLKSTRIRSVSGEQIVVSNSDLLSSRLKNFQRMERRQVLFTLGINYGTPQEKLALIPDLMRSIIETYENTSFVRAVFQSYGESALIFEIMYFMETADIPLFKETHHAINMEIYRRFEAEGIEISTPSQTIFLEQLSN